MKVTRVLFLAHKNITVKRCHRVLVPALHPPAPLATVPAARLSQQEFGKHAIGCTRTVTRTRLHPLVPHAVSLNSVVVVVILVSECAPDHRNRSAFLSSSRFFLPRSQPKIIGLQIQAPSFLSRSLFSCLCEHEDEFCSHNSLHEICG